jgi:hypothetical protein
MDEHNNDQRMASACTPPPRVWCSVGLTGTGFLLCRAHSFSKIMLFKAIDIRPADEHFAHYAAAAILSKSPTGGTKFHGRRRR